MECDYLYGWIKKMVSYTKVPPKMVNSNIDGEHRRRKRSLIVVLSQEEVAVVMAVMDMVEIVVVVVVEVVTDVFVAVAAATAAHAAPSVEASSLFLPLSLYYHITIILYNIIAILLSLSSSCYLHQPKFSDKGLMTDSFRHVNVPVSHVGDFKDIKTSGNLPEIILAPVKLARPLF